MDRTSLFAKTVRAFFRRVTVSAKSFFVDSGEEEGSLGEVDEKTALEVFCGDSKFCLSADRVYSAFERLLQSVEWDPEWPADFRFWALHMIPRFGGKAMDTVQTEFGSLPKRLMLDSKSEPTPKTTTLGLMNLFLLFSARYASSSVLGNFQSSFDEFMQFASGAAPIGPRDAILLAGWNRLVNDVKRGVHGPEIRVPLHCGAVDTQAILDSINNISETKYDSFPSMWTPEADHCSSYSLDVSSVTLKKAVDNVWLGRVRKTLASLDERKVSCVVLSGERIPGLFAPLVKKSFFDAVMDTLPGAADSFERSVFMFDLSRSDKASFLIAAPVLYLNLWLQDDSNRIMRSILSSTSAYPIVAEAILGESLPSDKDVGNLMDYLSPFVKLTKGSFHSKTILHGDAIRLLRVLRLVAMCQTDTAFDSINLDKGIVTDVMARFYFAADPLVAKFKKIMNALLDRNCISLGSFSFCLTFLDEDVNKTPKEETKSKKRKLSDSGSPICL
jgi:hypothetical protein